MSKDMFEVLNDDGDFLMRLLKEGGVTAYGHNMIKERVSKRKNDLVSIRDAILGESAQ